MKINTVKHSWKGALSTRKATNYIVVHHRAGNGDVKSIHSQHINQGYTGIGYHFYIRKDGGIYTGRPIDTIGAHAVGYNSVAIGVCFEGDFHALSGQMSEAQYDSGIELIKYLCGKYPDAKVVGHRDLCSTACPGQYFPLEVMKLNAKNDETNPKLIAQRLGSYGIVTDVIGLITEMSGDVDGRLYWLARKSLEYIATKCSYEALRKVKEYTKNNDIVWELGNLGLVNDKSGFLTDINSHPNGRLYWLARKVVTYIRNHS